jgi:secondary thiamine-phosphate synthase enzyme
MISTPIWPGSARRRSASAWFKSRGRFTEDLFTDVCSDRNHSVKFAGQWRRPRHYGRYCPDPAAERSYQRRCRYFCPSSTSALTTLEFEPGCVRDLQRLFDEIASPKREYAHNARWGDGNGHSHVRAALLGPSLTVPFMGGRLTLGTWQQIVYVDFDNRRRRRELIVQIIGE